MDESFAPVGGEIEAAPLPVEKVGNQRIGQIEREPGIRIAPSGTEQRKQRIEQFA